MWVRGGRRPVCGGRRGAVPWEEALAAPAHAGPAAKREADGRAAESGGLN